MDWITFIWGSLTAVYFLLAWIHVLILLAFRGNRWNLVFVTCMVSAGILSCFELYAMKGVMTPSLYERMIYYGHFAFGGIVISATWLIRLYCRAGRRWLAWLVTGLRLLVVVINSFSSTSFNIQRVSSLERADFLNGSFPSPHLTLTPWMLIGPVGIMMFLVYCVEAMWSIWRRGERKMALMVGGSTSLFALLVLFQLSNFALIFQWGLVTEGRLPTILTLPLYSLFFLGVALAISYELSSEVVRAARLANELRENERRLALAVKAADIEIWNYDFKSDRFWLSPRLRRWFGAAPDVEIRMSDMLDRLHQSDRKGLVNTISGTKSSKDNYSAEFRVTSTDGHTIWIVAMGEVERGSTGEPLFLRGVSLDITRRKMAEEQAIRLSGMLLRAHEEERARLARDLQEDLSQNLAVHSIELELLGQNPPSDPEVFARRFAELSGRVAAISTEVHKISYDLHPAKLRRLGLAAAIRGFIRDFAATQEIAVEFVDHNLPDQISPDQLSDDGALCLYRILQESLRNVVRHSQATTARVELLGTPDEIRLTIADDGCGFDPEAIVNQQSLGIVSMKERARLVSGRFLLDSRPGEGTRVAVSVPLSAKVTTTS